MYCQSFIIHSHPFTLGVLNYIYQLCSCFLRYGQRDISSQMERHVLLHVCLKFSNKACFTIIYRSLGERVFLCMIHFSFSFLENNVQVQSSTVLLAFLLSLAVRVAEGNKIAPGHVYEVVVFLLFLF